MTIALSLAAIVAAWVLLLLKVEPVPTWFYVFVWYPTLVLLDGLVSRREHERPVYRSAGRALSLLAWSPVVWLLFEAANFRLRNWYYVFLPFHPAERWLGIILSFATVLPALFLTARLLDSAGVGRTWRSRPVTVHRWHLDASVGLGLLTLALALAMPQLFFPLTWGALWLLAEPAVYRRHPEWSLFHDIERGEWGRIARLLLGGFLVGVLWECYNFWAHGKWIYTVPWLEHVRLFEMPPLGFVGFPLFALEAWTLYHALAAFGVAVPFDGGRTPTRRHLFLTAPAALGLTVGILLGMEAWTISSTAPRVAELPGVPAAHLSAVQQTRPASVFALAAAAPDVLARQAGLAVDDARAVINASRLVTLRGIGTAHARTLQRVGVTTVCQLAGREPAALWSAVHQALAEGGSAVTLGPAPRPIAAEVGVWVRAARRDCATG
jgi:predicted flap endonuclease-1-like 5' DNA nuclease